MTYKVKVFLLPMLVLGMNTSALCQNLVSNPSFEEFERCPEGITQSPARFPTKTWYSPTGGTPDYYNLCAAGSIMSIPDNKSGYQEARSGNGYIGISCSKTSLKFSEYIQQQLTRPLIKDHEYLVVFWISLAEESSGICRQLGAFLGEDKLLDYRFEGNLELVPDIYNSQFATDSIDWVKISGVYKANGGERFITIGHFPTSRKDYRKLRNRDRTYYDRAAHYYIDDVSVVEKGGNHDKIPKITELEDGFKVITDSTFVVGKEIVLPEVTFGVGRAELNDNIKPLLDSLAIHLNSNPSLQLSIAGHTDSTGVESDNKRLSQKRARAVMNYLANRGVSISRIRSRGHGSKKPIATNKTKEGRAENRRVEILIEE